jgi:APA family basic amino acid/polyamine antiporter
VRLRL